jgi:hypothetical protein
MAAMGGQPSKLIISALAAALPADLAVIRRTGGDQDLVGSRR